MTPPPVYGDADYPRWLTRFTVEEWSTLSRPNLTDYNHLRALLKRSRSKHAANLVGCHDKQVIQRVVDALQDDTLRLIGNPTRPGARVEDYLVLARDHAGSVSSTTSTAGGGDGGSGGSSGPVYIHRITPQTDTDHAAVSHAMTPSQLLAWRYQQQGRTPPSSEPPPKTPADTPSTRINTPGTLDNGQPSPANALVATQGCPISPRRMR